MKYCICFICAIFLFGCTTQPNTLKIRVSIESSNIGYATVKVYPENDYGEIVSGAVVIVRDENNVITNLEYHEDSKLYLGTINCYENNVYSVEVESNYDKQIHIIKVPHKSFVDKPVFTTICDETGSSSLKGQSLNPQKSILLNWSDLGEGVVYQVNVKNNTQTFLQKGSEINSFVIPENTLKESSVYYISVTAQYLSGDILYRNEKYYSASFIQSSIFTIYTQ